MKQYFQLKAKYPDAILLYRVGDFYETFGDDAKEAAAILGIVLTSRNNGGSDIALAGFPHHSLDTYLPKLVQAGKRVALCEQLEKPSKSKKVVKRGVTEVITPGLSMSDKLLDHQNNNFLASIAIGTSQQFGIAFLDLSTGEFFVSEGGQADIEKLIQSFYPAEVIFPKGRKEVIAKVVGNEIYQYGLDDWIYAKEFSVETLLRHFKVKNLKGFGIQDLPLAQIAAGAALRYLDTTENKNAIHLQSIQRISNDEYVWMDRFTIRSLELLESQHPSGVPLVQILDRTASAMGARQLKRWITLPLTNLQKISDRLDIVSFFASEPTILEEVREIIQSGSDIERLCSRIPMGKINPRELKQLQYSLDNIPELKTKLSTCDLPAMKRFLEELNDLPMVRHTIDTSVVADPATSFGKEPVIKDGVHPELDDYRYTIKHAKELLLDIQVREAEQTGITNLKIGFNNVFGYYLEVTNKYKDKGLIPDEWIRKQTLTNSERYITEELKVLEEKILAAEEKSLELEEKLFKDTLQKVIPYIEQIQHNAALISEIDILQSFAAVSLAYNYHRPKLDNSHTIDIKDGRHPVIEQTLPPDESYIPNDIFLDNETQQIMMITGPNMSGKSAVLRQTAIICLLAQIGCFVPASEARLGLIDKIFTRVGASDNISSGESTFMVEMNETSSILNNVSQRSLILLDEIGRGTSTFDGISIAWAIAEYLHDHAEGNPKTLFATHYHELNELAQTFERVHNVNVSVKESGRDIIFLRKLKEGGSAHSFGIHVAKMAGMPTWVVIRAKEILSRLESQSVERGQSKEEVLSHLPPDSQKEAKQKQFQEKKMQLIQEKLEGLDITTLTPIDSLLQLKELIDLAES